jgi:hypothetical protein
LHCHRRFKNGQDHCYGSIAEIIRIACSPWVQRQLLYLGEINHSQKAAWTKTLAVFDSDRQAATQLALFPSTHSLPAHVADAVQVRLREFSLHRPRPQGACWVACKLWQQLDLDAFWSARLPASRDHRPDCVQVVVALIVTPEGYPLAYEVLPGNTSDKTTLAAFLEKIQTLYGKPERIWVMDRGTLAEAVLQQMRQSAPKVFYLVDTPQSRLSQFEQACSVPRCWSARGQVTRVDCGGGDGTGGSRRTRLIRRSSSKRSGCRRLESLSAPTLRRWARILRCR